MPAEHHLRRHHLRAIGWHNANTAHVHAQNRAECAQLRAECARLGAEIAQLCDGHAVYAMAYKRRLDTLLHENRMLRTWHAERAAAAAAAAAAAPACWKIDGKCFHMSAHE